MSNDTPSTTPPAWTCRCFASGELDKPVPPDARLPGRPAPQFVGLGYEALRRAAAAKDFHLIVVGQAGHCVEWVECLDAGRHVFVALMQTNASSRPGSKSAGSPTDAMPSTCHSAFRAWTLQPTCDRAAIRHRAKPTRSSKICRQVVVHCAADHPAPRLAPSRELRPAKRDIASLSELGLHDPRKCAISLAQQAVSASLSGGRGIRIDEDAHAP